MSAAKPAWDSRFSHHVPHTFDHYYPLCALGGILSCGLTHTAVVSLDIAKCRMQVDPQKYTGLLPSLRILAKEGGVRAMTLGWFPTLIGYSLQGMFKFGLYEVFKDMYANVVGEETAAAWKGLVWLSASASAEVFADVALCPFEMVKVKVQTSPAGTWPTGFLAATAQMNAHRAETRFPFGSLVPLWSRQVPYTMAKFYFFEKIVQLFYQHVFTAPKETYNKATQLSITFASGYLAGVVCAIVSHPADTLVSQIGKAANKGKPVSQIMSELGAVKLFTMGIGTRILMIGTLTGLQWWIYDTFKTIFGLGTSGGK